MYYSLAFKVYCCVKFSRLTAKPKLEMHLSAQNQLNTAKTGPSEHTAARRERATTTTGPQQDIAIMNHLRYY